MSNRSVSGAVLASLHLLAAPAIAAPIPISAPGTIDAPGRYVLTQHLITAPYEVGVLSDSTAGAIDIDLAGFGIRATYGPAILVLGANPIRIHNGAIQATPGDGVHSFDATPLILDGVAVAGDWGIWSVGTS